MKNEQLLETRIDICVKYCVFLFILILCNFTKNPSCLFLSLSLPPPSKESLVL